MALHDTAALAGLLATIVVPNYPCLAGTDIPILDIRECARRATPEQKATAKHARDVMEKIWTLDEEDPVFRLLEGITKREEVTSKALVRDVQVAGTDSYQRGCRLPNELMNRVLRYLIHDSQFKADDFELLMLGALRRVSRAIKGLAESMFPHVLTRYVSRLVRHLVHIAWQGSDMRLAKLASSSASLLGQAHELHIFVVGDDVQAFSTVLALCTSLKTLTIVVSSRSTSLCGLTAESCTRLSNLRVQVQTPFEEAQTGSFLRTDVQDTYVDRPSLPHLLGRYAEEPVSIPSIIACSLLLDNRDTANAALLSSLRFLYRRPTEWRIFLVPDGRLEEDDVEDLGLDDEGHQDIEDGDGVSKLVLRNCRMGGAAVAALNLRQQYDLRYLDLSHNFFSAPELLELDSGSRVRILDLSSNYSFASAHFGLARNRHLRSLDLSGCFRGHVDLHAKFRDIVTQIKTNTSLRYLSLSSNMIDDAAARDLHMLRDNTALRVLSLYNNSITDAGLQSAHLEENKSLLVVDLRCNDITKSCAASYRSSTRRIEVVDTTRAHLRIAKGRRDWEAAESEAEEKEDDDDDDEEDEEEEEDEEDEESGSEDDESGSAGDDTEDEESSAAEEDENETAD